MRKQILAITLAIMSLCAVPTYAATITAGAGQTANAEQTSTSTEQKSESDAQSESNSPEGITWIIDPSTPGSKLFQPYGTTFWWQAEAVEQAKKWAEDHKGTIADIAGEKAKYEAVAKEVCDFLTYDETHNYANAHIAYTIRDGKGVCSDYTTLGKALCDLVGITAKVSSGASMTSGLGHDMLKVTLDGVEYYSDLSGHDLYGSALLSTSLPSGYKENVVKDNLYDAAICTGADWRETDESVASLKAKEGEVVFSSQGKYYYVTAEDNAKIDEAFDSNDWDALFSIYDKYGMPHA